MLDFHFASLNCTLLGVCAACPLCEVCPTNIIILKEPDLEQIRTTSTTLKSASAEFFPQFLLIAAQPVAFCRTRVGGAWAVRTTLHLGIDAF